VLCQWTSDGSCIVSVTNPLPIAYVGLGKEGFPNKWCGETGRFEGQHCSVFVRGDQVKMSSLLPPLACVTNPGIMLD
jgi:hypothetical protein